jgi:hypothetical protein
MAMGGYEYTIAKMMDEIMSMINKTSRATLKLSNTKDNKDNGEATSN